MRFNSITTVDNTGNFKMGCIVCKEEGAIDGQPMVGAVYECAYCGESFRITRVFLCLDCSEVHVRGKEYPTSTGWELTK